MLMDQHQPQQIPGLVKSSRELEAEQAAENFKEAFKKDSMELCTNILLEELAEYLSIKRETKKITDIEKIAKLIQTLYSFRKDPDLSLPEDIEEAIIYLNDKRLKDEIASDKFRDLNFGLEQRISYTKMKELVEYIDSNGIESLTEANED